MPDPYALQPAAAARMAGEVCIVTGAASGIGRAIARLLAAHGASVVVADVTTAVIEGGVPQAPSREGKERSEQVVLLTNLVDVPAEVIAAMYRLRWQIELFFRFFKHVLGCRDLISNKPEGVAIQIYCALIAALLMCLTLGRDVGRRGFRILCLYFQGWADEDEVLELLSKLKASKKKS